MMRRALSLTLLSTGLILGLSRPCQAEDHVASAAKSIVLVADSSPNAKQTAAGVETKSLTAAYNGAPVLDSSNYFGGAAMGYAAAKAAPQVMSKIFCWCGCDATDHHHHLIDCFTSTHGVDCHICQEEAVMGLRLFKDGTPMSQIQKQIDEKYESQYPFQEETEILKQYKTSRLYKPTDTAAQANTNSASQTLTGKPGECTAVKSATATKAKPGFHAGTCCSADHN